MLSIFLRTNWSEEHGVQLILKPKSFLKNLEIARVWKKSIPPYKLPKM
jgi:hypothetical protein